jgi:probable H4MPT-linked C1 transfer pathway protein
MSRGVSGLPVLGWDVGGANIKVARLEHTDGSRKPSGFRVLERPFALWREPKRLPEVLAEVADAIGRSDLMAVTMTAELADCFATKRAGVGAVLDAFTAAFPGVRPWIYGVDGRFRSVEAARAAPLRVAAANWMASASLVAQTAGDAIFIDVGSTTTDIIPIAGGRVVARGRTDPARLRSGELVYTGALRTSACAIARTVPLRGRRCRVAAEHFATAADVHLWLRHIEERHYTCDTADGRGRTRAEAAARLARMVCGDLEMLDDRDITAIAEHFARAQVKQIAGGLRQVIRRLGSSCPRIAVLAGQGLFLARRAAEQAGLDAVDLSATLGRAAARSAPSAAVAYLLQEWRRREGVEPSGDLTAPRLVLKTSGTTGRLPSPDVCGA